MAGHLTRPAGPRPTFTDPPLLEVALAVEFAPLDGFGAVDLAAFAEASRSSYPTVRELPPLPPPHGEGLLGGAGAVVSMGAPQVRLWLISDPGDTLVQVQRDRLVMNWRASTTGEYPRYADALRPEFVGVLDRFRGFVDRRVSLPVRVVAAEATYVNRVDEAGSPDLVGLLRSQVPVHHPFGSPASMTLAQTWNRRGDGAPARTVTAQAQADADVTFLTITGRAAVRDGEATDEAASSLDTCHDDVIATFLALTTDDQQSRWGYQR